MKLNPLMVLLILAFLTFIVPNARATSKPPIAKAGADKIVNEQTTVLLDGSSSIAPSGTITQYLWEQSSRKPELSLSNTNSSLVTFTAPVLTKATKYTFKLTVTDNTGKQAKDTVVVTVIPVNTPPIADAGNDQYFNKGTIARLDGSHSHDSDGNIKQFLWQQTGGPRVALKTASSASPTFVTPTRLTAPMALVFRLTVTDNENAKASDTVTINVKLVNAAPIQLNDTGITACGNGSRNRLACPIKGFPNQDAQTGRDETHNDDSDGHAGFSFTKISANGQKLPASASAWNCVLDNVTGLMWEIKTTDGGLHEQNNTYSWYEPGNTKNGGFAGDQNGGFCTGSACDTHAYVQTVNAAGYCGYKDWRLPTHQELQGIVNYNRAYPAIDIGYYPNTQSEWFWSSSPYADISQFAWIVGYYYGFSAYADKRTGYYVRLVR